MTWLRICLTTKASLRLRLAWWPLHPWVNCHTKDGQRTNSLQTVTGDLTDVEKHEPTITILLTVSPHINSKRFEIKLRQNMPFGNLVQILKAKFDPSFTEGFVLHMDVGPNGSDLNHSPQKTWRIVFDSDTPASVRLAGVWTCRLRLLMFVALT